MTDPELKEQNLHYASVIARLQAENARLLEERRLSPQERYSRDPWFRNLVDFVGQFLDTPNMENNFTVTELREAVVLAAQMHESRRIYQQRFIHPSS